MKKRAKTVAKRQPVVRSQQALVRALKASLSDAMREAVEKNYPEIFKAAAQATFEGGFKPWIELWNGLDVDADRVEVSLRDMVSSWLSDLDMNHHAVIAEYCAECFDTLATDCRKKAAEIRGANGALHRQPAAQKGSESR